MNAFEQAIQKERKNRRWNITGIVWALFAATFCILMPPHHTVDLFYAGMDLLALGVFVWCLRRNNARIKEFAHWDAELKGMAEPAQKLVADPSPSYLPPYNPDTLDAFALATLRENIEFYTKRRREAVWWLIGSLAWIVALALVIPPHRPNWGTGIAAAIVTGLYSYFIRRSHKRIKTAKAGIDRVEQEAQERRELGVRAGPVSFL